MAVAKGRAVSPSAGAGRADGRGQGRRRELGASQVERVRPAVLLLLAAAEMRAERRSSG